MSNQTTDRNLVVVGAIAAIVVSVGILYKNNQLPESIKTPIDRASEAIGLKEKSATTKATDAVNKAVGNAKATLDKAQADLDRAAADLKK